MLDILPALLWIIAAVIAVTVCLITAIRGNLFSKKTPRCASGALVDHRAAFHLIGHWRVAISGICDVQVGFLERVFQRFYEHVGWPSAAVMVMLIAAELVFMYLQARNGMHSEMERKLNQAVRNLT